MGRTLPRFLLLGLPFVLVGQATAALSGCLLDADGFSGGVPPSSGDGGPSSTAEAGGPANPGTEGGSTTDTDPNLDGGSETGGPGNILINGDFELGCAGWESNFGSISESNVSRSGGKSCRFCMGTNYKAWLSRSGRTNVVPGRHYHGEIWIKGAETPQVLDQFGWTGSSLNLFSVDDSGGETTGPTTAADWVRLTTLFEAPRANESVGITINLFQEGNPAAVGDRICFYLDDAIVRPID